MSTQQSTVDYLAEQMAGAGKITTKKMFGEYGAYCDGKVFAFICDDKLFIKITDEGRAFLGDDAKEAPAYPGSKPYFEIAGEKWDDADWMAELVTTTCAALPEPKPKSAKPKTTKAKAK